MKAERLADSSKGSEVPAGLKPENKFSGDKTCAGRQDKSNTVCRDVYADCNE